MIICCIFPVAVTFDDFHNKRVASAAGVNLLKKVDKAAAFNI